MDFTFLTLTIIVPGIIYFLLNRTIENTPSSPSLRDLLDEINEHLPSKSPEPVTKPTPHISPSSSKQNQIVVTDKQAYLKSDHWQTKRKARLKLDNYTCQSCLSSGVPLEVHHLHYRTHTAERLEDLVSLCRSCHERQHQHYGFDYNTEFYPLV
jgi:5-methylcytosine-specific restriction endonuclease McrA